MAQFWGASGNYSEEEDWDNASAYSSRSEVSSLSGVGNFRGTYRRRKTTGKERRVIQVSDVSEEEEHEEEEDFYYEEDQAAQVGSPKEQFLERLDRYASAIKLSIKNKDHGSIHDAFEDLTQDIENNQEMLDNGIPLKMVRILVELEDHVNKSLNNRRALKLLTSRQGRALTRLKIKLKRHNIRWAPVMAAYRKHPLLDEETDEDDEDDEDGSVTGSSGEGDSSGSDVTGSGSGSSGSGESSGSGSVSGDESASGSDSQSGSCTGSQTGSQSDSRSGSQSGSESGSQSGSEDYNSDEDSEGEYSSSSESSASTPPRVLREQRLLERRRRRRMKEREQNILRRQPRLLPRRR